MLMTAEMGKRWWPWRMNSHNISSSSHKIHCRCPLVPVQPKLSSKSATTITAITLPQQLLRQVPEPTHLAISNNNQCPAISTPQLYRNCIQQYLQSHRPSLPLLHLPLPFFTPPRLHQQRTEPPPSHCLCRLLFTHFHPKRSSQLLNPTAITIHPMPPPAAANRHSTPPHRRPFQ